MILTRAAHVMIVAGITWGAFAFGAVYPWAYWPLAVVALCVACIGLLTTASAGRQQTDLAILAIALAAFIVAIAVQLIPLSNDTLRSISPATPPIVAELDPAVRMGVATVHPLSIVPANTIRGLVFIAALALLVIGASRLLSITGVGGIARAIAVIGVLLALTAIVQQPLFTGKIYGLWTPQHGGSPYGPFVNRNHFAGWMLMGLPLALGLLCGAIARVRRSVRPGIRETILWLSSPHASRLLLLTGAVGIMTLSLIRSTSRSGMAAAAVVVVLTSGLALRQYRTTGRKIAVIGILCVLLAVVVGWAGAGTIASRFASANPYDLNGRVGPWEDALRVVRLYPLTGTGLNTYGVAMYFHQQYDRPLRYLQAHNDYLQLAAEGGLLLTIPAVASLVAFVVLVRRRFALETSPSSYWIRAGAVLGLLAIALQEMVDFSLQMPGNAFLCVVLCAIALHRPAIGNRRHGPVASSEGHLR